MPAPQKSTLETSKTATNPDDQIQAAIDPTGGVKIGEPHIVVGIITEKLEEAIDPSGAVKKTDIF